MVVSSKINELSESSSFDQRHGGCSKGIFEDESYSKGIFSEFLRRMNPGACLGACSGDIDEDPSVSGSKLRSLVPALMDTIDIKDDEQELPTMYTKRRRNLALKSLYELACEKQNRIPMVCTQKYNVVAILSKCLIESIPSNNSSVDDLSGSDETRRIACLILNQLSLPFQNKKVMVLNNDTHLLIHNILHIITLRLPETYLCCICLMNLTYLEAAVWPVLNFSTHPVHSMQSRRSISNKPKNLDPQQWNNFPYATRVLAIRAPSPVKGYIARGSIFSIPCLDDYQSLIRSIESLMHENRPFLMSKILSVEGEAVRWSVGLMRNFTKKEMHCSVVARTEIPNLILSFIRQSPHSIIRWNKDSVEKMSLEVLANMALFEETKSILLSLDTMEILRHIDDERERLDLALNTAYILKLLSS